MRLVSKTKHHIDAVRRRNCLGTSQDVIYVHFVFSPVGQGHSEREPRPDSFYACAIQEDASAVLREICRNDAKRNIQVSSRMRLDC